MWSEELQMALGAVPNRGPMGLFACPRPELSLMQCDSEELDPGAHVLEDLAIFLLSGNKEVA